MTQLLSQFVDFPGAHQTLAILTAFVVAFGEALLIIGLFVPSTVVQVGLGKTAVVPVFAATIAGDGVAHLQDGNAQSGPHPTRFVRERP